MTDPHEIAERMLESGAVWPSADDVKALARAFLAQQRELQETRRGSFQTAKILLAKQAQLAAQQPVIDAAEELERVHRDLTDTPYAPYAEIAAVVAAVRAAAPPEAKETP